MRRELPPLGITAAGGLMSGTIKSANRPWQPVSGWVSATPFRCALGRSVGGGEGRVRDPEVGSALRHRAQPFLPVLRAAGLFDVIKDGRGAGKAALGAHFKNAR